MEVRTFRLDRVESKGAENYVLYLKGEFEVPRPGQFCMLSLSRDWPVLLPRPFSYFDVEPGACGFASFLVKAIGEGTHALVAAKPGSEVLLTGPLGLPFPNAPKDEPDPICIAGGVGLAPFLLLTKERQAAGKAALQVLFGAASKSGLVAMDSFADAAQHWQLATDDGSEGFHGNALELYRSLLEQSKLDCRAPVYCCGPERMMKAVAEDCMSRSVRCLVSLETYMACGYGVCNGCSVEVTGFGRLRGKKYAKTCTLGPVFDARELVW